MLFSLLTQNLFVLDYIQFGKYWHSKHKSGIFLSHVEIKMVAVIKSIGSIK